MTTTITADVTTGVTLTTPNYDSPVVIADGVNVSGDTGVSAADPWTVQNYGTITGTAGNGVSLTAGAVTNAADGSISGSTNGVAFFGEYGTVVNAGTIAGGANRDGVNAVGIGDGTISGTFIVTNTGTITGGDNGVHIQAGSATLENAGSIGASSGNAAYLDGYISNRLIVDPGAVFDGAVTANGTAANVLELASGAASGAVGAIGPGTQYVGFQTLTIDSGAQWDIGAISGASTIENAGAVGAHSAFGLNVATADAEIGNTGSISGYAVGVYLTTGGTITNDGGITGGVYGVDLGHGGALVNDGSGVIAGGTIGAYFYTGGSLTNTASASISGDIAGVRIMHATGTVDNAGTIASTTGTALDLESGGSVTNAAGATISGSSYGVHIAGAAGTVVNSGSIVASGTAGRDIQLDAGGSVTNTATGTIAGSYVGVYVKGADGTVINAGLIDAGYGIAFISTPTAFVDNSGTIASDPSLVNAAIFADANTHATIVNEATGVISGGGYGVALQAAGTIENDGLITGARFGGVFMNGGSLTNATTGTISGYSYGINDVAGPFTLDNAGTIIAAGGPDATGIHAFGSSSITNETGGTITGTKFGVYLFTQAHSHAALDNAGVISGASAGVGAGVQVGGYGGTLVNQATGTIAGNTYGVILGGTYAGASATLENAGTITGTSGHAVSLNAGTNRLILDAGAKFNGDVKANATAVNTIELKAGGAGTISGLGTQYIGFQTVTIDSGAHWTVGGTTGGGVDGIDLGAGAVVTIATGSTIVGTAAGIVAQNGGSITNAADATITGASYGVDITGATGTVVNSGSIVATGTAGLGISLDAGGSVTNTATGTITSNADRYPGMGIRIGGTDGTVINAGHIDTFYGYGIVLESTHTAFVDNSGTITTDPTFGGGAVNANTQATIVNEATGVINGGSYGVLLQAGGTVENDGRITGARFGGVYMKGGSLTNATIGTISGARYGVVNIFGTSFTLDNAGTIIATGSADYSAGIHAVGSSSITNESGGTITGTANGVYLFTQHGLHGAVDNAGVISGTGFDGVEFVGYGGTLVNHATGTIAGNAYGASLGGTFAGASATLENAGTITGTSGHAVVLNAATNRLIVDAGAVFNGDVKANATAANTIELKAGGVGTLSGLGDKYVGFQTVAIDSGATWTVAGTIAGFSTETIQGFDTHDRLDLTNLTYDSHATLSINGSDMLSIVENGTTVATIQLSGDFTGDFFHLTNDGHGGSYVTENNSPACYCRGTLILTDRGQVAVEDLEIGDKLITVSGKAMPLKWIGRRNYRGWAAKHNDQVQPIRFKAGSIADNIPARDLLVSPEHAMFLDGVLIPARHLVNGVSILKTSSMEDIQYFHLELETHAVIVAEGALSESFIDDNSRGIFQNADEYRKLYPNAPRPLFAQFCAPRVEDGAVLQTVRDWIAERSTVSADDRQPWALAS